MKKTLLYVGAALTMVFSLNSCNKEIQNPEEGNDVKQGTPFAIVANPVETRTENDGMSTKWVADDAINVFHAEAGTTTYVNDGKFTIAAADLESSVFRGTVTPGALVADKSYDWYMFYPYTSQMVTPGEKTRGYVTVGSSASGSQTQAGNNSMDHLAGSNVPLLGKIANVSSTAMPSVSVNQACAFLEINVTNNSGNDLSVSQVLFSGTEPIVGTYYINFAGNDVVYTASGDDYVSEKAKLTVSGGSAIANGGSAKFYLAIKPFSAPSNGKLKITVNGYEKEITLSSAIAFTAGKIKRINFDYDKVYEYVFTPEDFELASSIAVGDRIIITNGTTGSVAVMKHYEGTNNNYKKVDATVSSGIITSTEDMAVLTVGGTSDNWTLLDESNSLYVDATNTTGSNHLKSSLTVTNYGKWTISFDDEEAVITCNGKSSRNIIRYNNANNQHLFSCYTSGQEPVYIFKQQAPKVLQSIALSGNFQTDFYVNDTFNYDGLIVTATYEDGFSKVVLPTSVAGYDMNSIGNQTVTVSYTENEITKTATYSITVSALPVLEDELTTNGLPQEFGVGDSFSFGTGSVTAHYDNGTTKSLTLDDVVISGFDSTEEVTGQTVTISYTEGEVTATAQITVKIIGATPKNYSEDFTGQDIGAATGGTTYGDGSWTHVSSGTNWTATDVSTKLSTLAGNQKNIAIKGGGSISFTGTNGITALSFDYLKPSNPGTMTVTVSNGTTNVYSSTVDLKKAASGIVSITTSDFSAACNGSFTVTISTSSNSLQINTVSWTSAK